MKQTSLRLGGVKLVVLCVGLAVLGLGSGGVSAESEKSDAIVILAVLEKALSKSPADRDLLYALATWERDQGRPLSALTYARRLRVVAPEDRRAPLLLDQLEALARAQ